MASVICPTNPRVLDAKAQAKRRKLKYEPGKPRLQTPFYHAIKEARHMLDVPHQRF
jgi:hypothetical protein